MASTVYASKYHLLSHGPNQSFGNHLLHIFFIYNISKKNNINLGIPCDSNLDEIFDLSEFKKQYPSDIVNLFEERYGGSPEEYTHKEMMNLVDLKNILENKIAFPNHFYVSGWFWHYELMPQRDILDSLRVKKNIIEYATEKYNDWLGIDSVTIHYRGCDFRKHSIGWGDLRLPFSYYQESIDYFMGKFNIKKALLVSDDYLPISEKIKEYFPELDLKISQESYLLDWIILKESKNLICSNSSFCWTAGLFDKQFTVQPKGFFLRNLMKDDMVFPPSVYYKENNKII